MTTPDKIDAAAREIERERDRFVPDDGHLTEYGFGMRQGFTNAAKLLRRHFAAEPQEPETFEHREGMLYDKFLSQSEPADHPEPSVTQDVCPKCGAAKADRETRLFTCGSWDGMPNAKLEFEQSKTCRIAELIRDLAAAREENAALKADREAAIESVEQFFNSQLSDRDRQIEGLYRLLVESTPGQGCSRWNKQGIDAALAAGRTGGTGLTLKKFESRPAAKGESDGTI